MLGSIRQAVCILAFVMIFPAFSNAENIGNFLNGGKYMDLDEVNRTMVVIGLYDMMSFQWDQPIYRDAADAGTRAHIARVKRCVSEKNPKQIRSMLDEYLTSNPDARRYNLASNFSAALNKICPQ